MPDNRDANIVIKETREQIIAMLNNTNLPISVIAMIVRELARDITAQEQVVLAGLQGSEKVGPTNGPT